MEFHMSLKETQVTTKMRKPPVPPPRKYVSMFRIDGVPIMPPLMTTEKRRQMQKIKEKAIKLEQKLEEKRHKKLQFREELEEVLGEQRRSDTARSQRDSNCSTSSSGSVSQRSYELEVAAVKQKQLEAASYELLSSLVNRPGESGDATHMPANPDSKMEHTESVSAERKVIERMQKLQKSETIIYDNCSNIVLMPMLDDERRQLVQLDSQQPLDNVCILKRDTIDYSDTEEEQVPREHLSSPKPTHLPLEQSVKQIPSIYVNPPTPLMDSLSFCEGAVCSTGAESFDSPRVDQQTPRKHYVVDLSSDDSFETTQSSSQRGHDLRPRDKVSHIPFKLSARAPLNTCGMKPPQRSATSPQLKSSAVARSKPNSLEATSTAHSEENSLVRSNSFTLDGPSKALLEHIRKQKAATGDTPTRRRGSPSVSATRDTVESKAKRVQKTTPKARAPLNMSARPQSKVSPCAASNSPYAASCNNAGVPKAPRSPYELKPNVKMRVNPRPLQKSLSNTTTARQVLLKNSMPTISNSPRQTDAAKNGHFEHELANDFELEHRQKFLKLIAQQQEEQKRLQQTFEVQQQQLFEQLSAEMHKTHILTQSQLQLPLQANVPTSPVHSNAESASQNAFNVSDVSEETSPHAKSEYSELSSLLTTAASGLPSLDMSSCSTLTSNACKTNHCTPRRRLFARDNPPALSVHTAAMGGGNSGGGDAGLFSSSTPTSSSANRRHFTNN